MPCCQTENIYLRDRQTKFVMVGLELLLGSWSIFSAEIASFIRIPFRRCKWNVNDASVNGRQIWRLLKMHQIIRQAIPWRFVFLQHSKVFKATPCSSRLLQVYCTITSTIYWPAWCLCMVYGVSAGPVSRSPSPGHLMAASLVGGAEPVSSRAPDQHYYQIPVHIFVWLYTYIMVC